MSGLQCDTYYANVDLDQQPKSWVLLLSRGAINPKHMIDCSSSLPRPISIEQLRW